MLPGDRLICLHHPGVQLAPQIEDYQAVPAEQGAAVKFLEDILLRPNAVPGMDPLHKDVQELDKLGSKIVSAFDKLSAVQTRWFGNFVELRIDNAKDLTRAKDLNRAEVIATAEPRVLEWITREVPELRIIDDDLWQAAKRRQEASSRKRNDGADNAPRSVFGSTSGPANLFSGLSKCG